MPDNCHAAGPAATVVVCIFTCAATAAARHLPTPLPFRAQTLPSPALTLMAPEDVGNTMRELQLMDLLQGCMRCPGHSPGVLAACASATAAGRLVLTPPCAHAHDCTALLCLWTHYCDSHHVAVDPTGAWPCNCSR
jgi:hypothetical protein